MWAKNRRLSPRPYRVVRTATSRRSGRPSPAVFPSTSAQGGFRRDRLRGFARLGRSSCARTSPRRSPGASAIAPSRSTVPGLNLLQPNVLELCSRPATAQSRSATTTIDLPSRSATPSYLLHCRTFRCDVGRLGGQLPLDAAGASASQPARPRLRRRESICARSHGPARARAAGAGRLRRRRCRSAVSVVERVPRAAPAGTPLEDRPC